MTDVFIRTMSEASPLRAGMRVQTLARWSLDPLARVHLLVDRGIREGRREAETLAESDPYIYTDDDVLPWGKNWIATGRAILLAHPEYAVASTRSVIKNEMCVEGPGDIYPVHAVGAPMWIRKGILGEDLPLEFPFVSECQLIDNYVAAKGYKEGILNGIWHLHLGYGFSTTPQFVAGY